MPFLPAASAIPGAVAGFLAIARGSLPATATVWFGKELSTYTNQDCTLQVSQVVGNQDWAEIGPNYNREEEFSLICTLSTIAGPPPNFEVLLPKLMGYFALLEAAVANNPTLNGAVRIAEVGNFVLDPDTDPNGISAMTIDFQVRCKQRVRSLASS